MDMNKLLKCLTFALIAVLTLGVFACSKADDPHGGNIIGSWKVIKRNGIDVTTEEVTTYLQFRTDGTVLVLDAWEEEGKLGSDSQEQNYERKGNKLYGVVGDKRDEVIILKLTKTEFAFTNHKDQRLDLVRVPDVEVARYRRK